MVGDCRPNAPIREKIRRIQAIEESRKEEPIPFGKSSIKKKKKDKLIQPTLKTFMNVRCGR